ncbi:MAG: response regulator [Candidatus Omnitrophica bacterium]|nr:response regulator [Candidatus Omnitrophota bacterium]
MGKKKILIVDDEESFLQMLKLNLEEAGTYEVMGLMNAKEILSTVHSFRPQVILLDLIMPTIGGLEVCEMLNNDPIGKTIPIIIISALDKDVDKVKAFKLGVVGYLVKPIQTENVIALVNKSLEFKQQ